jgi:hypothetical protein
MRKNRILQICIVALLIGSLAGIIISSLAFSPNVEIIGETGEIVYIDVEGGFFAIQADDGEFYDPINLPDEYKVEGLRIQFLARTQHDMVSYHMFAKIVEILYIAEIKLNLIE